MTGRYLQKQNKKKKKRTKQTRNGFDLESEELEFSPVLLLVLEVHSLHSL